MTIGAQVTPFVWNRGNGREWEQMNAINMKNAPWSRISHLMEELMANFAQFIATITCRTSVAENFQVKDRCTFGREKLSDYTHRNTQTHEIVHSSYHQSIFIRPLIPITITTLMRHESCVASAIRLGTIVGHTEKISWPVEIFNYESAIIDRTNKK